MARFTLAEKLINDLHDAFDYTQDNNRDLVGDQTFPMGDAVEELGVAYCYQFLCAYIARNEKMINDQLENR